MIQRLAACALALTAAAWLAACDRGGPRVAFVTNNPSDFWSIARAGTEDAARDFGIDVDFRIPQDGTAAQQQAILEDLLAQGVRGIAISPVDPINQTPILARVAGEVPLVCQDSDAPESGRIAYVGTDNVEAGRAAGRELRKAVPEGGEVILFVGTLDALNARQRREGILQELEGSDLRVVDTRTDNTDRARARSNVEDALVDAPGVKALVGLWSYNGPAILAAVRAAGKAGDVKIVCFDEEEDTLRGVADGAISATIVQQPYKFGYESIRILAGLARGDRSVIPEGGVLAIPIRVIDRENVQEFQAGLAKVRGR